MTAERPDPMHAIYRRLSFALAILLAAVASVSSAAANGPTLVIDVATGRVLHQDRAAEAWYPASLTKLMTAYVAFHAIRSGRVTLDTPVVESALARSQSPSKMGFPIGTQFTLDNALKMLIVKSANDVAVAIAERVGGNVPDFVAEMNRHASRLGMTNTRFINPNGLPGYGQQTSARDLAVLARAIIREFPEHEGIFRIPAIRFGNRVMRSPNALLVRYTGTDGMKTGFICASGFNVVASATRGGRRLIVVVLGAPSGRERAEIAARLLETNFSGAPGALGFFGSAPEGTNIEQLANIQGTPPDMREEICRRRGRTPPSEVAEDDGWTGAPAAAYAPPSDSVYAVMTPTRQAPNPLAAMRISYLHPPQLTMEPVIVSVMAPGKPAPADPGVAPAPTLVRNPGSLHQPGKVPPGSPMQLGTPIIDEPAAPPKTRNRIEARKTEPRVKALVIEERKTKPGTTKPGKAKLEKNVEKKLEKKATKPAKPKG